MTNDNQITAAATQVLTVCHVRLPVEAPKTVAVAKADAAEVRRVENVRNCDIFVDDSHVLIYADVRLLKYETKQQLDIKDMKNLIINFNTQERYYELQLPCFAQQKEQDAELRTQTKMTEMVQRAQEDNQLDLWKFKRITEQCQLQLDNNPELLKCCANFDYGFASRYQGRVRNGESDLNVICRMPEPKINSPLQRAINREIDELKSFSREQYKLNFVELEVPEGHDNPMKFSFNFDDCKLSEDEELLLHNLTSKSDEMRMPDHYDQMEVDCGLISLLLPICYDLRSTGNEPTCESAWTRSILSAMLFYFEPFNSMKDVVISFLRRSLIYPLYRNYDLGLLCVQDGVDALQRSRAWLLKQLLITHTIFLNSDASRDVFNRYYIVDYIRYMSSETLCPTTDLELLAHNLKNVLLDVRKKSLRLDLINIETELLKELIADIHINDDHSSEGDSDVDVYNEASDDADESEDDDEIESSDSSDSEQNSVIEQQPQA